MAHTPTADAARARFDAATATHLTGRLVDGVVLEPIDGPGFHRATEPMWARADGRTAPMDLTRLMSEDERAAAGDLEALMVGRLEHRIDGAHGELLRGLGVTLPKLSARWCRRPARRPARPR